MCCLQKACFSLSNCGNMTIDKISLRSGITLKNDLLDFLFKVEKQNCEKQDIFYFKRWIMV